MPTTEIGVIGLGNMGGNYARHLVDAGFDIRGFDIDADARRDAEANGVTAVESLEAVVPESGVVVSSLPDPAAVEAVYLDDEGVLAHATAGLRVIETSTINPETSRSVADAAAAKGVEFLDAPVSGGLGRAESGTLTVMVGGDREVFEAETVQRVLRAIGSDIYYAGGVGAGHTMKLLNNMISAATGAVVMEAAALAAELDVDWDVFMDVVSTSSGSSYVFRKAIPRILNRDFSATFTLNLGRKDTQLALAMADEVDFPLPMASVAYQLRTEAIAKGLGEEGSQALVKLFEENSSRLVEAEEPVPEDRLAWHDKP